MYVQQRCEGEKNAAECIETVVGPDGFPPGILTEVQFRTTYSSFVYLFIGVDSIRRRRTEEEQKLLSGQVYDPTRLSACLSVVVRHVTWMLRAASATKATGRQLARLVLATEIPPSGGGQSGPVGASLLP